MVSGSHCSTLSPFESRVLSSVPMKSTTSLTIGSKQDLLGGKVINRIKELGEVMMKGLGAFEKSSQAGVVGYHGF